MSRQLAKAEILWTRKCPLKCSYCAMIDYDFEQAKVELMCEGVRKLKSHGCEFFAIYGSSPLWGEEFVGLRDYVQTITEVGALCTVIADGVDKMSLNKLAVLHEVGLRSLTVSYDADPADVAAHADPHTRLKAGKGIALLRQFKAEFKDLRDAMVVATVTRKNWRHVLDAVPILSDEGIHLGFDFVHPDKGHPGTKCKGDAAGLKFEAAQADEVAMFAEGMLKLKQGGALIHPSALYLSTIAAKPSMVVDLDWKCLGPTFPSWVTIDADGTVLPCDDFWTDRSFKVWDFDADALARFSTLYDHEVRTKCNGCLWNTHWDAVAIVEGRTSFEGYVHKERA